MINLDKIVEKAAVEGVSANLVLKEYIHFFILEYLFRSGYFSHLVFQGGTALRFAYGGVMYSEDLDFVLNRKNKQFLNSLTKGLNRLTIYLDRLLPFVRNTQLRIQKNTPDFKRFILTLEIETFTAKDRTHIEVLNIPSYDNQIMIIRRDGIFTTPAIRVETPKEILSDKLLAIGARDYIKGRDLWDVYFLLNTLKVTLDKDILLLVQKKIRDYHMDYKEFNLKMKDNISLLEEKGGQIISQEMDIFLPVFYRRSFDKKYKDILEGVLNASLWIKEKIKP